jgi:hypothetical protein
MSEIPVSEINEKLFSVIYRGTGRPTVEDYEEAILALLDGMRQLTPDGENCRICHDSGHQAWECHHNPLVVARGRLILQSLHCGPG